MLESIRGIEKAIAGKTFRDYERSWVLRSALERGIEVISEASRHLGRELKSQHKDVRWKDIAGIGNILRHEYQRVDGQIIWNAVKDDLPALKKALLAIRASLDKGRQADRRDCFVATVRSRNDERQRSLPRIPSRGTRKFSSSSSLTGCLPLSSRRPFTNTFDAISANARDILRVARAPRRLTPRQPKFDTNKKGRIARMY